MPHTTLKYKFELEIADWAASFSFKLTGDNRGFLLLLDAAGAVRRIYTGETPKHFDLELKRALAEKNSHWLFYHPFDAPEYTWLEWQNVEARVLERLRGKTFEISDMSAVRTGENINRIPTSWSVMF